MSAPNPSFFKNLIPGATSSLCEKFNKLLVGLSQGFADWVAFEYSEDGQSLTDEYITLLCAAQCNGSAGGGGSGGTTNPNMPTPTGVTASDGTYSSKVRVTWNAVTPPTGSVSNYYVYRSLSTNTDPSLATLIATVSGATYSYDDSSVTAGISYNYWVKATNGTDTSAFGGPDAGYATAYAETLAAPFDLQCSKGFSETTSGLIAIVFTAPGGTSAVDLYRHTSNDSSAATLVHADIVCGDTTTSEFTPADGTGVNNSGGTELTVYDQPPDGATKYYYWVKCKTSAPPQISGFSNGDDGWVQIGTGDSGVALRQTKTTGSAVVVPGGCNHMRIVLWGGGGAGAGGSAFYGGGGGAGGDVLLAEVDVTPLEAWTFSQEFFVNLSASFGNPAAATPLSGLYSYEGKASILTRDSDSKKIICLGGGSGLYSSSGSGSGGPRPSGSVIQSGINASYAVLRGKAGEAAVGSRGGRGGAAFGWFSTPPAHYLAGSFTGDGDANGSGGGGSSVAGTVTGGSNAVGKLIVAFYT